MHETKVDRIRGRNGQFHCKKIGIGLCEVINEMT